MVTEEQIKEAYESRFDGVETCLLVQEILELEEKLKWIPVAEKPKKRWEFYSGIYIVTDGEKWIIARYHFPRREWEKMCASDVGEITHYMDVILPVKEK